MKTREDQLMELIELLQPVTRHTLAAAANMHTWSVLKKLGKMKHIHSKFTPSNNNNNKRIKVYAIDKEALDFVPTWQPRRFHMLKQIDKILYNPTLKEIYTALNLPKDYTVNSLRQLRSEGFIEKTREKYPIYSITEKGKHEITKRFK
jgi:predicted transcriptional regulator